MNGRDDAMGTVFSSLVDSFEAYHQCLARANRVGSTKPLNVHLPLTEIERPMAANVLRKANHFQQEIDHQERLFRQFGWKA